MKCLIFQFKNLLKILHINTYASGGAFNGCYRLHQALLKQGVESKILVKDYLGNESIDYVEKFDNRFRKETIFNRVVSRFGFDTTSFQKKRRLLSETQNGNYEVISFPFSDIDITESDAYKNADIIHLHWVGDYLDCESFFKKNKKPLVWTLRDTQPFQGIFHYENDLKRNNENWKVLNEKMALLKYKYLQKISSPLQIVGISNWITSQSLLSPVLNTFKHNIIHNCIDSSQFKIINKKEAREKLNIQNDRIVFCFVADSIARYNKGFAELKVAIENIDNREIDFLSVGNGIEVFPININHRHLGVLNNEQLELVYSASDAFIFPSKEETLGNVMLEAMSCGTPVIGTPVGGLLDVIRDGFNGVLAEGTSSKDLKNAIERFIKIRKKFDSVLIRDNIIANFSPQKIANSYIEIYSDMLSS